MDIVIVSQYLRNIEKLEGNNSRFIYLANLLSENNDVEIITSNFMHAPKTHAKKVEQPINYKITAIDEPGYCKNVCLKRFYSHSVLAKNIKKYLKKRRVPDYIYCAIPSLDVAKVISQYCKKENVRFIIDVQDIWPEAFKMVLNVPILSDIIFKPMMIKANKIYSAADNIVAVSETYANRALKVNKKSDKAHIVYLGTEKESFDSLAKEEIYANNMDTCCQEIVSNIINHNDKSTVRLVYVGTLGHSYDISLVLSAMRKLPQDNLQNLQFIVMGDGPKKEQFENEAKGLPVFFTGRLSYQQMVWILTKCDISVNPIVSGAAQSIINKHMDYAMSGLPVLNTQECVEYRNLIDEYEMGLNCECGDSQDLANKMLELIEDEQMREEMGQNARKCAEDKFDRKNSYKQIYKIIMGEGQIKYENTNNEYHYEMVD